MKRALAVFLLFAAAVSAAPAKPAFDRKQFEIPHTKFVLDNGLTPASGCWPTATSSSLCSPRWRAIPPR